MDRDFATLLDEIIADHAAEASAPRAPSIAFDYLDVASELLSGHITISPDLAASEYGAATSDADLFLEAEQVLAQAEMLVEKPAPLLPTDPESIGRELGLDGQVPPRDLDRLRREFAFRNHPDRVGESLRDNAALRMQVANMLIDEAKKLRGR